MGAPDNVRRSIDADRRRLQSEFSGLARRWRSIGLWLLSLAAVCWGWVLVRLLTADTKALIATGYGAAETVEWAVWSELMLMLAVSVPLGVVGAALYARGATSLQLSHHAVTMAEYLDRAQAAADKARREA